jgi:hypothetical protein
MFTKYTPVDGLGHVPVRSDDSGDRLGFPTDPGSVLGDLQHRSAPLTTTLPGTGHRRPSSPSCRVAITVPTVPANLQPSLIRVSAFSSRGEGVAVNRSSIRHHLVLLVVQVFQARSASTPRCVANVAILPSGRAASKTLLISDREKYRRVEYGHRRSGDLTHAAGAVPA